MIATAQPSIVEDLSTFPALLDPLTPAMPARSRSVRRAIASREDDRLARSPATRQLSNRIRLNQPVVAHGGNSSTIYRVVKRLFDLVFSLLVIVLILSWLYPIIAILIKLSSKGPVLFKQARSGVDNEVFK